MVQVSRLANGFLSFVLFSLISCSGCNQTANQPASAVHTDTLTAEKPVIDTPPVAMVKDSMPVISADSTPVISAIEEKIMDTISRLAEVKKRADYIEQQTKGERHLKIWIPGTLGENENMHYWVKAGEDNGSTYVTHFNFYVYPKSMRIMYLDVVDDKEITIKAWEKQLNKE